MESTRQTTTTITLSREHCNPCQFIFPQEFEEKIEISSSVKTLKTILGGINLEKYKPKHDCRGRKGYEYRPMMESILYAYSLGIYSVRKIEEAMKNDIRFIWLSGDIHPSYKTISQFINYQIGENAEAIFKELNDVIEGEDDIDVNTIYIDGTKLEANATKFSFVWKKATMKYQEKLMKKMSKDLVELDEFFKECNIGIHYLIKDVYQVEDFIEVYESLDKIRNNVDSIFIYGKGHRKNEFQKWYEIFEGYKNKALEYSEKIRICGKRNSYSKTDHDATMMHGKEDYYNKTGIFKAYYNVQVGVSNEYIRLIGVYQDCNDLRTFKPFLEDYHRLYQHYPKYPVCDAGYGSYENYMYCLTHHMELVQKYNTFAQEQEGKTKQHFTIDEGGNYRCPQGHLFEYIKDTESVKYGVYQVKQCFVCHACNECPMNEKCAKGKREKSLSINIVYEEMKQVVQKNLTSDLGIQQRVRRSIEAEGAFGIIKQDWDYRRIHRRGMRDVKLEMFLVALGFNIKKFHQKTVVRKSKTMN